MNSEMLSEHEGNDNSEDSSSSSSSSSDSESSPPSPPRVDDSPLQKCMDRNKQCEERLVTFWLPLVIPSFPFWKRDKEKYVWLVSHRHFLRHRVMSIQNVVLQDSILYSKENRGESFFLLSFLPSLAQSGGFVRNVNHDRDNSCRAKQRHLNGREVRNTQTNVINTKRDEHASELGNRDYPFVVCRCHD